MTDDDIAKIAGTYHAWCGDNDAGNYADVPGFCKAVKLDDIRKHGHVLTLGRYVGTEVAEKDDEPFEEKGPGPGPSAGPAIVKRLTFGAESEIKECARGLARPAA